MSVIVTLVVSEDMVEYVRNVLGHGGCNTFPEYKGECTCAHN